MNARPMLAAFFLLVPVTAACAGTDTPAKPTAVSTFCETKDLLPTVDAMLPSIAARVIAERGYRYENTTYTVWSDGSKTELSKVKTTVPCQK